MSMRTRMLSAAGLALIDGDHGRCLELRRGAGAGARTRPSRRSSRPARRCSPCGASPPARSRPTRPRSSSRSARSTRPLSTRSGPAIGRCAQSQSRLRAYRVSDDQLHTQRVSLREEYDWTEQGRVSLGFRYSQSLTLQVEGTDRAGQLIDRIVSAGDGAVSINSVSFSASGRAEAEREVLLAAMDDARATADAMAAQIGKEIVDTIEVTVASNLSPVATVESAEATSPEPAAAEIALLIRAGQDDVQVSVVMKFVAR